MDHMTYSDLSEQLPSLSFQNTLRSTQQVDDCWSIFKTNNGYCGGEIIKKSSHKGFINVRLTHDKYGNHINNICVLPTDAEIHSKQKIKDTVYLYTCPLSQTNQLQAENYIHAQGPIDTKDGIGSGIIGKCNQKESLRKMVKYPIYNPLTLHNVSHKEILSNASAFISQIVDEYLENEKISAPILEQTCWLMNVVLYIDGHHLINSQLLQEAISYFCYDYIHLPKGTFIRQPINYIFDTITIDGIYSKFGFSMSHLPTDFKGIHYKSI
jgi:hypothetical protein